MLGQDWLVKNNGKLISLNSPRDWDLLNPSSPYRLYQFLIELDNIMSDVDRGKEIEEKYLLRLRHLTRKLIVNTPWISNNLSTSNISALYDEPGYPYTLQREIMLPGSSTFIHNHGTWAIVATLQGMQKNILWEPSPALEYPHKIRKTYEKVFQPGDIVSFTNDAIHSVEAVGEEPSVTLNIYGETDASKRLKFDIDHNCSYRF
ncbi:MAG: cupin [Candidatus Atelocyanobacterium thalassa]